MKVYHGSEIKGLTTITAEFSDPENFEGAACYFSDSFTIAKEYALNNGSVYEVNIEDELLDLTTKEKVYYFLNKIFQKFNITTDDFEFLDAGVNHVLRHTGKNGVWCLGKDVAGVLKFEPKFKDIEYRKELEKNIIEAIDKEINSYQGFMIQDSGNYPQNMIIHKGPVKVVKEFNF